MKAPLFGFLAASLLLLLPARPVAAQSVTVTVPTTPAEWQELWSRVKANPYTLAGAGRDTALAVVLAALRTRDDGPMWAAYGPTICAVPGPERVASRGDARRELFRASLSCIERILDALPASGGGPMVPDVRSMLARHQAQAMVEVGELGAADSVAAAELDKAREGAVSFVGDIQYWANEVRGQVALRGGDHDGAVAFLRLAAGTEGSPGLNSFGPRFFLARELLEAGEIQPVLEFLDAVGRFWTSPDARAALSEARDVIHAGRVPSGARWW